LEPDPITVFQVFKIKTLKQFGAIPFTSNAQVYLFSSFVFDIFTNNDHAGSDMSLNGLFCEREKRKRGRGEGMWGWGRGERDDGRGVRGKGGRGVRWVRGRQGETAGCRCPGSCGNGEWRLVGGGCLFLELRRAESPRSCEGERMVCFEKGVGGRDVETETQGDRQVCSV